MCLPGKKITVDKVVQPRDRFCTLNELPLPYTIHAAPADAQKLDCLKTQPGDAAYLYMSRQNCQVYELLACFLANFWLLARHRT